MFTGIVQQTGTVIEAHEGRIVVQASGLREGPGDSIAVNGCCLTVATIEGEGARVAFDVVPETRSRTNIGGLRAGDEVNLEPALRMGDALGGHWVQGHIDDTGTVVATSPSGNALDVRIEVPERVGRYCVERGSITIDGVSLTVMQLGDGWLQVSLIPETRERTTLGRLADGDVVNLEADILARYVERLLPRVGGAG